MEKEKKDRLFVPLNSGPFDDFSFNGKTFEIRGYGRQYTEKHVYPGRDVELRKGYSGESLKGKIGQIEIGSLSQILKKIDYKLVIPLASSELSAFKKIKEILGSREKYIAFEVLM